MSEHGPKNIFDYSLDLDRAYFRQAGLSILNRTQQWLTYWMHDVQSQKDGLILLASSTALVQCRNELIIEIFGHGIKGKPIPEDSPRDARWLKEIEKKYGGR